MILILREEILSAIILIFLIFYYSIHKVKDKQMQFLRIACVGLLHVLFDILTVISVNHMDVVSESANRLLHGAFYFTGILFTQQIYNYVIYVCAQHKHLPALKRAGYIPVVIFLFFLLILPMEYVEGRGTYYSYGPLAFIGYGLFVIYCSICMGMLLVRRKRLDKRVQRSLIPMIAAMLAAVVTQALIPELLMTGGGITVVCIGMFVALDNPDKDYERQAMWDFNTGLKNRNCYKRDMELFVRRYKNGKRRIGFLVADMNFLKAVNDIHGHAEGDRLLQAAAAALREGLKTANGVYRLGGDEFAAVYIDPQSGAPEAEMGKVRAVCAQKTGFAVPLSLAMGYAEGPLHEDTEALFKEADVRMYEDKTRRKKEHPELDLRR